MTSCQGKAELYAVYPRKGDSMNIPWAGTGFMSPKIKQYILSVHTVVLKGIDFLIWEYVLVNRHIKHRNKLYKQLDARILPLIFDRLNVSGSIPD